jgi:hypothetical protein
LINFAADAFIATAQSEDHKRFTPTLLLGLSHDYPVLSKWLSDNLEPSLEAEFRMAEQQCLKSNDMYAKKEAGLYYKHGIKSLSDAVPVSVVKDAGVMGTRGPPNHPWYLYHASIAFLSRRSN